MMQVTRHSTQYHGMHSLPGSCGAIDCWQGLSSERNYETVLLPRFVALIWTLPVAGALQAIAVSGVHAEARSLQASLLILSNAAFTGLAACLDACLLQIRGLCPAARLPIQHGKLQATAQDFSNQSSLALYEQSGSRHQGDDSQSFA